MEYLCKILKDWQTSTKLKESMDISKHFPAAQKRERGEVIRQIQTVGRKKAILERIPSPCPAPNYREERTRLNSGHKTRAYHDKDNRLELALKSASHGDRMRIMTILKDQAKRTL